MKKPKQFFFISILLFLSIGCSKENNNEETKTNTPKNSVTIAISSEPENGFDPTLGWGHGTTPLIQSTLVEYNEKMEIVYDLATDYNISQDGLNWVFKIRDDVKFTDGTPLTAEDIAFTFTTAKNSASSLDLSSLETCIATNDFEVTFTLNSPTSTFINTMTSIGIVPKNSYSVDYSNNPIGSGPWKLSQWIKGEQLILLANEDYYREVPKIEQANILFMNEDTAFTAAKSGQVDVALTSAALGKNQIEGMTMKDLPTLDNRGITLPVQPTSYYPNENSIPMGNDVTSNLSIRQAIAYGVDREKLAKDAVNGFATPAYSENDGMPWNNPETKIDTDIEKAKKILEEDNWKDTDGDGILEKDNVKAEFTCLYPSGDSTRQALAMAVSSQLLDIGIKMNIEGLSWDQISNKMFSNAVLMGWGEANPYTSYLLFHSKNMLKNDYYNPEGYSNPVVDKYLDNGLQSLNIEDANENWKLSQWDGTTGTAMKGDCPWVWLVNLDHIYYVKNGLNIGNQNLHPHGASWSLLQNLRSWTWEL